MSEKEPTTIRPQLKPRTRDLTGLRFGRLTVIEFAGYRPPPSHDAQWLCQCKCGTKIITLARSLLYNHTNSCGCLAKQMASEEGKAKTRNLSGRRFGKLTVTGFAGYLPICEGGKNAAWWYCTCDCGKYITIRANSILVGHAKSCGCLQKEWASKPKTHGMSGSPEYAIWLGIIQRCNNPNSCGYRNYGGRGIRICTALKGSFATFIAAIGHRPGPEYTIDRANNNGNYSCGKCRECLDNGWNFNLRWATYAENQRNKRTNRLLTYQGRTDCITGWSEKIGIDLGTLRHRLRKEWGTEKTLLTPVNQRYGRKRS